MRRLQDIVAFWRDCIVAEGALEQSFGISSQFRVGMRTRARLFQADADPFIFTTTNDEYVLQPGELYEFTARASLKGQEVYYGYPLLMFYDQAMRQHRVAPLFVIRLSVTVHSDHTVLTRGEPTPMLGSKAFEILGLRQEEIAALNTEIGTIFASNQSSKLDTILYLLQRETTMTFVEGINPKRLSDSQTIHPYTGAVVYNRALIYASEASTYNLHVLNDLEQLVEKKDLATTALGYLESPTDHTTQDFTPVLPFAFDEYQLEAIRHIMGSKQTVVTGPPGTGKSQFIANLIINLFLQKKRVLFVSHTGEAVRVVNERVNEQFANLMLQTGKKEIRQDLGRRLAEMVAAHNEQHIAGKPVLGNEAVVKNWAELQHEAVYLRRTNELHARLSRNLEEQERITEASRARVRQWLLRWRIKRQTKQLRKRRTAYAVADSVHELKERHVQVSREYVQANYLSMIFKNELYGKLVAYIEAVQNRRPSQSRSMDRSDRYVDAALQAMSVWSCTLKSLAATFPLRPNLFDYVIFDEASQIDLPSAAPALYRAKQVVVVGDAKQLLHIAKINQDTEDDLAKANDIFESPLYPGVIGYREASLFNSAKRSLTEPEQQLKNHYRSNPAIANLFSSIFYAGTLRLRTPDRVLPDGIRAGVVWRDVQGTVHRYKNGSRYNQEEVDYIVKLVGSLLSLVEKQHLSIGVVTPYAQQRERAARQLIEHYGTEALANVRILTVHQFQGAEVDILLFSTVLAENGEGNSDYWYMKNEQLLNVAVSRARHSLIIVGDRQFALHSQSKLKAIAEYCLQTTVPVEASVPNRPMNVFERQLLQLLIPIVPRSYSLQPQYVVGGRYTLDFVLLSKRKKIAVELDGSQHEIIGGLPVFDDVDRDAYLVRHGWHVIRVPVHELVQHPDSVTDYVMQALKAKNRNNV